MRQNKTQIFKKTWAKNEIQRMAKAYQEDHTIKNDPRALHIATLRALSDQLEKRRKENPGSELNRLLQTAFLDYAKASEYTTEGYIRKIERDLDKK